jgi:hypothetical protein
MLVGLLREVGVENLSTFSIGFQDAGGERGDEFQYSLDAAVRAARALDIPMVGLDLMVSAADQPEYVFIEANERAGLANHEPQPTAERFVDLLFPHSQPVGSK